MKGIRYLVPNAKTDPEFAEALKHAKEKGVNILAFECDVTPGNIEVSGAVPVVIA